MINNTEPLTRKSPYQVFHGNAAEDLGNDVTLKVIAPDILPNAAVDTVGAGISEGTINLTDRDGKSVSATITTANHIVATWEGQSNQRVPPKVRKGEPVEIYKLANQDKYYWRTTGRGRDFRTTDRVYFEIGATDPTKPGVEKDDTNTWSAWMDSEKKTLGFKTAKANGEVCALTMEADLEVGTFLVSDDGEEPGNRLFLDTGAKSGNPIFQINLSTGTTLKLEGDNLFLKVPGKAFIDISDRLVLNSPITVFNSEAPGDIIMNAKNLSLNATKDLILKASGVIGLNGVATKINGVLAAASIRAENVIKGAFGSAYKSSTIQRVDESPVTEGNNSPDTSTAGVPYKN